MGPGWILTIISAASEILNKSIRINYGNINNVGNNMYHLLGTYCVSSAIKDTYSSYFFNSHTYHEFGATTLFIVYSQGD